MQTAPRRHRRLGLLFLGMLLTIILATLFIPAQAYNNNHTLPATIYLGKFTNTLPVLAAQTKGFYAAENLTVIEEQVTSSTQAYQALNVGSSAGGYDILLNSPDNVINYRLNASNPLGTPLDVKAFFGDNYGLNLTLVTRPGITSAADLRGKTVAVDARDSGFAFVLYKILRQYGLERDQDYKVVLAGGGLQRYQALLRGEFEATLLNGGFETRAANAGYVLLNSVCDVAYPYLGGVAAAKTGWLEQNRQVAVRFVRAYYNATEWVLDPANREEAINLLMMPNVSRQVAEELYKLQVQDDVGIIPDLSIERKALYTVLKLREEFNGFDQPQDLKKLSKEKGGIYDLSYLSKALHSNREKNENRN